MDDTGEESMQYCSKHPYRRNPNPGGICGFCLEEKLGKLLSSSQSIPSFFPAASSPGDGGGGVNHVAASSNLSRSKSSAPIRRKLRRHGHLLDSEEYSPRKGGFWSFLHLSSRISRENSNKNQRDLKPSVHPTTVMNTHKTLVGGVGEMSSRTGHCRDDGNESPNSSHASAVLFGQKVARSRSVGCGSRSFSGDLLERISTGLGDCALRRVESQREAKQLSKGVFMCTRGSCGMGTGHKHHHGIKEKIKCGGILGGFSQSSSSYWASSSEDSSTSNRRIGPGSQADSVSPQTSRNKSWGWALASPMRAFKSSPRSHNKSAAKANATAPNLAAIPALLMVGN